MKRLTTINVLIALLLSTTSSFSQLVAWQFGKPASVGTETTYNATTNNVNLESSVLKRGSGITGYGLDNGFSSNNWTSTLSTNRYYEFSIQPKTNYKVSLSTLDAKLRCSSYGPKNYIWKYSIDGGNTFIEISGGTLYSSNDTGKDQTQINLSGIAELQNVTAPSTIIFRVYAWNASATSGTFAFGLTPSNTTANCLAIGGTVGPIPVISSFTPTTGAIGTTVTINGKNFNTDKVKNIVFFGATMATVSAASATSLTVIVPKGATYHAISVTDLTTGLTGYSEKPFISTFSCGGFIDATSFATKQEYKTSGAVYGVAIGDLDGDGKPDLAVPNYVSQTVSVFKNTSSSGTVSFASKQDLSTSNPTSVAIGDLDGDGKPELVVGNGLYITVTVFRNTSTSGAVSFAAKQDFTTGSNPHDIAIGDLDGDGKPELVTANYGSNTISVFRNTSSSGTVSFVAKQDFTTGAQPFSVSIGDLDGDGKQDLTVPNSGSTTVSILKNTSSFGMINFADKNDLTTGSYPTHVAIGDLDGDGMPDLAVTNSSSTISVLRNTGSFDAIAFASKQDFTTGSSNQGVAIGDLNGDGKPDLAAVNSHYQINTVSVLRNTGSSGTVSFASKQDFTTGNYPIRVVIGDFDGDGQSDLAVGNYNDASVSVLRNAIPRKPVMSSTSTDVINSGATVNIPLTSNFASTYTWVAADNPNTTGESLSLQTTSTLSNTIVNNSTSVQTVTYTVTPTATGGCGEGIAQIVTVTVNPLPIIASISPSSSSITGGISVVITGVNFTSASNVKFGSSSATSFTVNSDTQITATAPAGSVGTVDITVTTPNGTSTTSSTDRFTYAFPTTISSFSPASGVVGTTVTIKGTNFNTDKAKNIVFFGATLATVSAASATSLTVTVPPGATYQAISITDLITGLTAYSAQPFITTFSCGGYIDASSFTTKQDFTTGSNPQSVVIGDIDGDGKPDLAVVNLGHSSSSVSVFRNTSSSSMVSFAAKQDFKTGDYSSPISVSIGDMDGDGKPDLVVANSSSSTVSVFRNTSISGTVSFAAKQDFTTDLNPKSLAIGDMDGDGKPEFAVVNTNLNTVSVFRNTSSSGTVSFAAKQNFSTGDHPFSVVIGDVDGDSKPELAVANWFSSTVSVFRNTSSLGTISFETKQDFTTGTYPQSLAIGDMDGDGKPDLALGTLQSSTVSILRNTSNTGTVHFATNQDFPTGSGPTSVAIGDVDGDGKPDLAVVNNSSQTVSILRNMSNSGTVSFDTKQDFTTTGPWTYCVAIGDVNGDSKPDLAVANYGSNTVSVLKNTVIKKAVMSSTTTAVINSGTKVSIPLTSNFNSTYTWVAADNPNTTGESLTLQTTNTLSNTIVNNSISIQTVTYTVTPTLTDGCGEGIAQIITVTVNPLPSITAISHLSGPTTGGTIVTITGTNLTNATSVKFGSTAATITENTTTSISAIAPAGTAGKVDITITTAGGTSAISSADEFTYITPKTVATAPTIGAATAGNGQASISFTTPTSNGGSTILGYTITSNPGGLTATGTTSPVNVTGLTNGTAYTFTVTATNSAGTSSASSASNSVTPNAPPTATTSAAADITPLGATLNGTVNANNASTTVTFEYGLTTSYGSSVTAAQSPISGTSATAVSAALTGLEYNTTYYYRVKAENAGGITYGDRLSFKTLDKYIYTISSPTATAIKLTTATLGATIAPANAPVLERGICWSKTAGVTIDNNKTSEGGTTGGTFTVNVSDIRNSTTIYYKGYVVTPDNETILSDEANFSNVPVFTGTGDWKDAERWNVKEVPFDPRSTPVIAGNCTISQAPVDGLEFYDLTINSGAKLTLNADQTLLTNTFTNNAGVSGLVIKASSTLPNATFAYNIGTPSATVEMYSKASWNLEIAKGDRFNWQYIGIPVKTLAYSPVFDNSIVRRYNESATDDASLWKMETADSTLTSGTGYELTQEAAKLYSFKGELRTGDFEAKLPYSIGAQYPGQHIFGNPFTTAVNISQIDYGLNTEQSVYLFNTGTYNNWKEDATSLGNKAGQYTVSTKLTAGVAGIPAQIPSMQGFLMKTTGTNPGSFTFGYYTGGLYINKEMQRAPRTNATNEKVITRIDVTSKQSADRMWIFTEPTCTRNFDNGWDGYKMMGSVVNPQLFAMEADGNYQINAVPTINETYLGFQAGQDTDYTLKFMQLNVASTYNKLYLMDLVDGHIVDITADGSEYSFKASSTPQAVKRFKIVADADNSTGNTEIVNNNLKISHSNETIYIENRSDQRGTFTLYDLKGVAIKINLFDAQKVSLISTRGLIPGVYLIKAGNGIVQVTEKIIIR